MTSTAFLTRSASDRFRALADLGRRLLGLPQRFRCESCPAVGGEDDFTDYLNGLTDGDQLCNDCHHEHAALAASDAENRFAYYCR